MFYKLTQHNVARDIMHFYHILINYFFKYSTLGSLNFMYDKEEQGNSIQCREYKHCYTTFKTSNHHIIIHRLKKVFAKRIKVHHRQVYQYKYLQRLSTINAKNFNPEVLYHSKFKLRNIY
jgi:hypothetical protein